MYVYYSEGLTEPRVLSSWCTTNYTLLDHGTSMLVVLMGLRAEDADISVVHVLSRPRVLLHALKAGKHTRDKNLVRASGWEKTNKNQLSWRLLDILHHAGQSFWKKVGTWWTHVVHGFPEKLQLVLGHGANLHKTFKNNQQKCYKNPARPCFVPGSWNLGLL